MSRLRIAGVLSALAALALAATVVWRETGAPPPPGAVAERVAPPPPRTGSAAPPGRAVREAAPQPGAPPAEVAPEEMHRYVVDRLAAILPEPRTRAERERLADLIFEAGGARGARGEPPAIAREIELRIAEEFQQLAGMRLGDAVSRLTPPEAGGVRPPRPPSESGAAP